VAPWIGDAITLGATVSAFGCCLACVVGGARLLFGLSRDAFGDKGVGKASRFGTPGNAGLAVAGVMAVIIAGSIILFHATAEDTFTWGGTIGTLILLVVYILATLGCIGLVFVRRKLPVARWQVVIPLAALVVLGYTLYRNVVPYPTGAARWFPVASGGWLLLAILAVVCAPGVARRLGRNLAESEGIRLEK
jgi:amino acid transporter